MTTEEDKMLMKRMQSEKDMLLRELNKARAIIYDLQYANAPAPEQSELKAEVVRLEQDLRASIEKRQKLKALLRNTSLDSL